MRNLTHDELHALVARRTAHLAAVRAEYRHLMNTGGRRLLERAEHGTRQYHEVLLSARRARDERLRWGAE